MTLRKISLDTSRAKCLNVSHTISVFSFFLFTSTALSCTRIRLVAFVCLGIGRVTLGDDTVSLSGAREMEGTYTRDDASRKHREIVVLARLTGTHALTHI